ncbi:MAG: O-antigen translocase [Gammaproteobacteria bacterium]|nr:O-antigen translocase [Gammaproteobacteria bacterium]
MSKKNSYRQILRSSSIIGGASVINILVGLLRTKVIAVVLGPAGVGLIGLLQSLMTTSAAMASLGFGTVGTRQIAEADGHDNADELAAARRALFLGTMGLAVIGAAVLWLARGFIAEKVLGDASYEWQIGWLAIGVALLVASGSQIALLNGMRRVGDIARVSVLSALLSTAVGLGAVWLWGERGILLVVLAVPFASFVLGHWFVAKLPKPHAPKIAFSQIAAQWKTLGKLGSAFMLAGLAATIGHLLVRTLVKRELGVESLGHFEASWLISMTYIGFVLKAMGTDFYPRLTAVINDRDAVNCLVNEQTEVALLLAAPVLLAMLGLSPWVIDLLYSDQFAAAASVLRWQVLGDVLKVAAWPIGFIILAAGDGRTFMFSESLVTAVFVCLTWIGLPVLGVEATGVAFFGMYIVCLPTVFIIAFYKTAFKWESRVCKQFAILLGTALAVFLIAAGSPAAGAVAGVVGAAVFGLFAMARLGQMADLRGPLGKVSAISRGLMSRMGIRHE